MWTRRVFLKSGGLALFSAGAGPRFLGRLALATPPAPTTKRPQVLVSIFLRGAMDGLMAVPPLEEPQFKRYRPNLAMGSGSGGGVLELDDRFGLHPGFEPILPFWSEGRLAVVHGVGSPNPTRSHFDAQDFMESGTPWDKGTPSGWLNRVAAASAGSASTWRAVALTPDLPRSLYGDVPALAISNLADFKLIATLGRAEREEALRDLRKLYGETPRDLLRARGREMFDAVNVLSPEEVDLYRKKHGRYYPNTKLGRSLLQIAHLIRKNVGLEIAFAESDSWDTHVSQGKQQGAFASRADDLARSMAAFWNDIEDFHDNVVVLTMTEFGRTVAENGSRGTDHGHGSCLFVLGNRVDGGKVYGTVPSLVPEHLFEGRDLPVTTDFRAVFCRGGGQALRHHGRHIRVSWLGRIPAAGALVELARGFTYWRTQ